MKGFEKDVQKWRWSEFTRATTIEVSVSGTRLSTEFTKPIFLFHHSEHIHDPIVSTSMYSSVCL